MLARISRIAAVGALVVSGTALATGPAGADAGPDTHTKITTPSKAFTVHFKPAPADTSFTVSGEASSDLSMVDIGCTRLTPLGPSADLLASHVPVTAGHFSAPVFISHAIGTCRLRAIPDGVDPFFDYIGSYTGPIMYMYSFSPQKDGSTTWGFEAANAVGSGTGVVQDASDCGVALLATISEPDTELRGPLAPQCAFTLQPENLTATGVSTAPAIRVSGKNAYLPGNVESYLRDAGQRGLTLPQPALTVTFSRNHTTGDVRVTESSRLKRCTGSNTYPPTAASCPGLTDTGVTFKRTLDFIRGAHQVVFHDSFVSNDGHAHTVSAQYQVGVGTPDKGSGLGRAGYIFPGHGGSTFHKASHDQVVTGLPSGPSSVLVRSDVYASSTDIWADTEALTWSRPPAKIQFSHTTTSTLALPYSFHVPADGAARIAFAESEAPSTAAAKKLAAKAVAAM